MDLFRLMGSIFIKNDDANSQIDTTEEKAKGLASSIGSAMEGAGKKITGLGKKLTPISVATGAILTASVKGASDFTDGMAKMSTLFDTTETSVSDLSEQFLSLSNKTGISASELAEAGYQALSAGQQVEDVAGFVETAGNLAKAGFTSTTTAVDVLTTAMNAYGDEAGSAEDIANKLVRTQNLGKTTVDELASSMGKIIPTASSMGVGIDNLTSGYVSLTKQGIATSEATTYMNSMLNELGDSGTKLGGIIKKKTGKSFQSLMNEGASLADVLQITKDYADENGIAYNELWGSAEAGKAGLAILNGGVEEFNSTVETMASDTDDVGEALNKLNTPSMKVRNSLNRIKNSGITLGQSFMNALAPTLNKICGVIEKATNWFNNLDDKTKTTIATVLGIVTALAPVLVIGGQLISGIGSVIGVVSKLWALLTANPITLIIALIAGLVAGFLFLWNNCEGFRNFWINLWNTLKGAVSTAWEAIKSTVSSVLDTIKTTISNAWETIKTTASTAWEAIKSTVSNVWEGIKTTVSNAIAYVKAVITVWMSLIGIAISNAWESIKTGVSNAWETIKTTISNAWEGIKTTVSTAVQYVRSVVSVWMTLIKTNVSNIWNNIKTTISTVLEGIKTTVSNAWTYLRSVISVALTLIKSKVSTIWNNIKTTISNVLDGIKTTVSTVFDNIKTTIYNAWIYIKSLITIQLSLISSKIKSVWDTVKTTISTVFETIKTTIYNAWIYIKQLITTQLSLISSKIKTVWTNIKTTMSTILEGIKTKVSTIFNSVKTTVQTAINAVKTRISTGLNSAKATVSSVLNSIRTKFTTIFSSAKNTVKNAIDKIKGFFKFSWSLPKLKLPHITISGSFSLMPPSAPSFGISWYKKAMEDPLLFTKPTLFDVNPVTGEAKGAGEAGDEMMYGHANLMRDIRTASGNNELAEAFEDWMNRLMDLFLQYFPQFANIQMVTDTGVLVGEIAPAIDKQLGKITTHKGRGN